MQQTLKDKLDPENFPDMPGGLVAILGFICDEVYTRPVITEIAIVPDGSVMAYSEGDFPVFTQVGTASGLERDWGLLMSRAKLTDAEIQQATTAFKNRIIDFRRGQV